VAKKETISAKEISDRFYVSQKTVYRWADRGIIPSRKTLSGRRFFLREDINKLLELDAKFTD